MRLIKYGFLAAVAVFVCYHYWPHQTVETGNRAWDKTYRAARELGK
jgi:hypothetical protein